MGQTVLQLSHVYALQCAYDIHGPQPTLSSACNVII